MNLKEFCYYCESVVTIAASGISPYTLCYRVPEQGLRKPYIGIQGLVDENTHKTHRLHKLHRL